MKATIITIATGKKYNDFCKKLIGTIKKNFIPEVDKKIVLFTDNNYSSDEVDVIININHLPAPLITLMRFHYITMAKLVIEDCDIVYYIDCDMEVVAKINFEEIKPDSKDQIIVAQHPWAQSKDNRWIVENNPESTAYIENVENYCQGCFFGAYKDKFFELTDYCNENINKNLHKRLIAKWYDESHFNKYINDKNIKILDWKYIAPYSEENLPIAKMIHYNAHTK
jgi:hypothetical protein